MVAMTSPALPLRQRILVVAARRFREHGYASTTVRQIATELGVTVPALYHHFRNKEAILSELVQLPVQVMHQLVDEVGALPSQERPRALLEGFLDRLAQHGGMIVPLMKDPSVLATGAVAPTLAVRRRILEELAKSLSGPDAALRAAMALSAVEGAVDTFAERSTGEDIAADLPRAQVVAAALRVI